MLGLFKEEEAVLQGGEALSSARNLLTSFLNKGFIPQWTEFSRELPSLLLAEDLDAIKTEFEKLTQWSFLKEILDVPATEYFFHDPHHSQRLTGKKEPFTVPLSEGEWQLWLEILSLHFKQNWNVQNPFVSFYGKLFGHSFRISLIHHSTSPEGMSKAMFRSLAANPFSLSSFEAESLSHLVATKKNILIAGSTGSGKTSLLTSLIQDVSPEEHLVVLEDTYEILSQHPHLTRLLAGDSPDKSLKAYLAYSLRLSPDRIILGEMRSHEVVPFVMAMNTGHRGLMGTIHASSAVDALNRVALLFSLYGSEAHLEYAKVMELICRNLEFVVFMENKKVNEVIRVLGSEDGVPFFESL